MRTPEDIELESIVRINTLLGVLKAEVSLFLVHDKLSVLQDNAITQNFRANAQGTVASIALFLNTPPLSH